MNVETHFARLPTRPDCKMSHLLSERVPLGMMEAHLNPIIRYCCDVLGVSGGPSIGLPWCRQTHSLSDSYKCNRCCFSGPRWDVTRFTGYFDEPPAHQNVVSERDVYNSQRILSKLAHLCMWFGKNSTLFLAKYMCKYVSLAVLQYLYIKKLLILGQNIRQCTGFV